MLLENAQPDGGQADEQEQSTRTVASDVPAEQDGISQESGLTKEVDLSKEPILTDPACSGYFVEPVSILLVIMYW